jgi:FkbM family methyltransferase
MSVGHVAPEGGTPPFGTYALKPPFGALRQLAALSRSRWLSSIARKMTTAVYPEPYDVEAFGGQRLRLYPSDNRAEKRVFTDENSWDAAERRTLGEALSAAPDGRFVFVDAGSNVGLYCLAVRGAAAEAGVDLQALAIEPHPVNGDRLAVNLALNAATEISVARVALTDGLADTVWLQAAGLRNRGEAKIGVPDEAAVEVPARSLLAVLRDSGFDRVDALKIDIEGHEEVVLTHFFREAPASLHPKLILAERRDDTSQLDTLLTGAGYRRVQQFRLNNAYRRDEGGPVPEAGT